MTARITAQLMANNVPDTLMPKMTIASIVSPLELPLPSGEQEPRW
jgi:hypothetical protein